VCQSPQAIVAKPGACFEGTATPPLSIKGDKAHEKSTQSDEEKKKK
jgi:hypothetical protein